MVTHIGCRHRIGPSDSPARQPSKSRTRTATFVTTRTLLYNHDHGWFSDQTHALWVRDRNLGKAPKQITEGTDWNDSDPQWVTRQHALAFFRIGRGRY